MIYLETGLPLRQALTSLVLPPVSLLLLCLLGGLLAWRGSRRGGLGVALAALALLLLSTPAVAGMLRWSLEREVVVVDAGLVPTAIIILGGDVAHAVEGASVGGLTLQRLRAGAALHRQTGLPLLVTGGVLSPGDPALALLMARSLEQDFAVPVRWVEPQAADTRGNAQFSAALLRADDVGVAFLVSHAWHLPRALAAFARAGLPVVPAPVLRHPPPRLAWGDWMPRPDQLDESWFALREWVGRIVYAIQS